MRRCNMCKLFKPEEEFALRSLKTGKARTTAGRATPHTGARTICGPKRPTCAARSRACAVIESRTKRGSWSTSSHTRAWTAVRRIPSCWTSITAIRLRSAVTSRGSPQRRHGDRSSRRSPSVTFAVRTATAAGPPSNSHGGEHVRKGRRLEVPPGSLSASVRGLNRHKTVLVFARAARATWPSQQRNSP